MSGAYYMSQEELEEGIGPDLASKLVSVFGGTRLYVPSRTAPDHSIAKAIGEDGAHCLCKFIDVGRGGMWIELPLATNGALRRRQERLRQALKDTTRTEADVVRQFGVSCRTVRRVRTKLRIAGDLPPWEPQTKLTRPLVDRIYVPKATICAAWNASVTSLPSPASPKQAALSLGVSGLIVVNAWRKIAEAAGRSLPQPTSGRYDGQANRALMALLRDSALADAQLAVSLGVRKSTVARMRSHLKVFP